MKQLQKALTDTEAWLESLDSEALASPHSDGGDLRAIGDALRTVAASDLSLAETGSQGQSETESG